MSKKANKLRNDGYLKLNIERNLDTYKAVKKIKRESEKLDIIANTKNKFNKDNKGFLEVITHFFDKKDLLLIANDKNIFDTVSSYFGFYPTIRSIEVWINFPTKNKACETQLFHRDNDDDRLIKLFIPISSINMKNGPFQFLKGSHKKKAPFEYFKDISRGKIKESLEHKIIEYFPNIISFTGSLGDAFLVDSRGLHRGLKPIEKYRIMISVSYTSPNPNYPLIRLGDIK